MRHQAVDKKLSTLWQAASCVNKYLNIHKNVNHIKHPVFTAYMKQLSKSYTPNKSDVIDMGHVHRFMRESEKTNANLCIKVCVVIGLYGSLRASEITYLNFEDIKKVGCNYIVTIRKSKTDLAGAGHEFVIPPSPSSDICAFTHIEAYMGLFASKEGRLFWKINKFGQPTTQPLGVNTISQFAKKVATHLGLKGKLFSYIS